MAGKVPHFLRIECIFFSQRPILTILSFVSDIDLYQDDCEDSQDDGKSFLYAFSSLCSVQIYSVSLKSLADSFLRVQHVICSLPVVPASDRFAIYFLNIFTSCTYHRYALILCCLWEMWLGNWVSGLQNKGSYRKRASWSCDQRGFPCNLCVVCHNLPRI